MDRSPHHQRAFAILRIIFGAVWLVDASFKLNPDFLNNFSSYLASGADGQPVIVQGWIHFWINIVSVNPYFFAIAVAVIELAIALSLLTGVLSEYALFGGMLMALVIWSTAEGFGGPYAAGSTDIGSAIIYVLVFVALIIGESWKQLNLTPRIKKLL